MKTTDVYYLPCKNEILIPVEGNIIIRIKKALRMIIKKEIILTEYDQVNSLRSYSPSFLK
jgi:hypothetical protein